MESHTLDLDIRGYLPTSLIDWPGHLASVVFLSRCPFRCPFCHNPELIEEYKDLPKIDFKKILLDLKARENWISGIVFTGGEPTIYRDLPLAFSEIKNLKIKIKLDTNGTNPFMIETLLKEKLVDCIAMDIKSSLEKYSKTTRARVNKEEIKRSINLIKDSKIDYEFRTTIVPGLILENDIKSIGRLIKGAKKYSIQQFRSIKTLDKSFEDKESLKTEELENLAKIAERYVKKVEIKGV